MVFKRHHLFVLIASLILVVAFIFPSEQPWSINMKELFNNNSRIFIVDDIDNMPMMLGNNDLLFIKKIMDKYFSTKYATILPSSVKIYKVETGKPDELIFENPSIVLIKSTSDDALQAFYAIENYKVFAPHMLPIADIILAYTVELKFGASFRQENFRHKISIVSQDDKQMIAVAQGDDASI